MGQRLYDLRERDRRVCQGETEGEGFATLEIGLARLAAFKAAVFNRSATLPLW